jgi:Patatin-like phospholipase
MTRVLSLDGGPGPLMELRVIAELERLFATEAHRGSFLDRVDLFAGTSNGGLMSLFLAKELTTRDARLRAGETARTTSEILEACMRFSDTYAAALAPGTRHLASLLTPLASLREIMVDLASAPSMRQDGLIVDRLRALLPMPLHAVGAIGDLWRIRRTLLGVEPVTPGRELEQHLRDAFGDTRLADLTRKVVILSFDTTVWKPRVFRNFWADDEAGHLDRDRDGPVTLVDAGMATASMPLFLPVFPGPGGRGYLDGIFAANNPVSAAITMLVRHGDASGAPLPLDEIVALSMGVSQTIEEANIEQTGGLGALIDIAAVRDRVTRMVHSARDDQRRGYFRDPDVRVEVHQKSKRQGVGGVSWGWLDYALRPTFVLNMLIHGMNGESSAQAARLLRGQFFRHAPRINLAKLLFESVFLGLTVNETEVPSQAAKCFDGLFPGARATIESKDDIRNRDETRHLVKWIDHHWFPEAGEAYEWPDAESD